MSDAILYTGQDDFDSIVLRWLVIEKEAPVVVQRLGPGNVSVVTPPYMVDQDLQLFDHWVILQYLQERYPGEQLMPIDPQVRGQIRQICSLLRDGEVAEEELAQIITKQRRLFLLGDTFTLADIYAGSFLTINQPRLVATDKYLKRLRKRPGLKEAQ